MKGCKNVDCLPLFNPGVIIIAKDENIADEIGNIKYGS
jgi:hypothetical protein